MKTFHIELPDLQIREALIDKINNLRGVKERIFDEKKNGIGWTKKPQ